MDVLYITKRSRLTYKKFLQKIAKTVRGTETSTPVMTSVCHEASRGASLIEEAYRLSIPILQKCFYDQSLATAQEKPDE